MSDGDRSRLNKDVIGSIVTAIALIGIYWVMFYDAGYQSGRHQERAQIERKHYAADTSKRVESECAGKFAVALRKCITEIVASENENKRDESDLAAQWQAADWVFWASIIAGAQLVATVIGLYFIKGTLDATQKAVEDTSEATDAMREANEISRNAGKSDRAWLVPIKAEHVTYTDEKDPTKPVTFGFLVKWTNTGRTPAIRHDLAIDVRCFGYLYADQDMVIPIEEPSPEKMKNLTGPGQEVYTGKICLNAEWSDRMRRKEATIVIRTRSHYFDIFSDPNYMTQSHITDVCFAAQYEGLMTMPDGQIRDIFQYRMIDETNAS